MSNLGRIIALLAFSLLGGCVGGGYGVLRNLAPTRADAAHYTAYRPAPHHVPPQPGGVSFRFAMLHDVIHERYPKHGEAYYRELERRTRERLAATPPEAPSASLLTDDLAIATARLGNRPEAIRLLREKLHRQGTANLPEADRYTTYANLGALLMEESEEKATTDAFARGQFESGVSYAERALKANPNAHFGRELWQVKLARFQRDAFRDPQRLSRSDFLNNSLSDSLETILEPHSHRIFGTGRAARFEYTQGWTENFLRFDDPVDDPTHWERLKPLREQITKLGDDAPSEGTPFDEPMLAVVGIWRQSPNLNIHLALAIGETMLRVGQRNIAWSAFERVALAPGAPAALREHSRNRQQEILRTFRGASTGQDERERDFQAELAYGESFQRDYQAFEAKQIASGVPLDSPDFYKPFFTSREPIASPSGVEELVSRTELSRKSAYERNRAIGWMLIGAAIGASLVAIVLRLHAAITCRTTSTPASDPESRLSDGSEPRASADTDGNTRT